MMVPYGSRVATTIHYLVSTGKLSLPGDLSHAPSPPPADNLLRRLLAPLIAAAAPAVTLTYAQSLDGALASARGARTALSGAGTLQLTHALRAGHDAIVVGVDTVLADDPRLNVRYAAGPSPRPVVLDTALRTPPGSKLLRVGGVPPVLVCAAPEGGGDAAWRLRAEKLEAAGATLLLLPPDEDVGQRGEDGAAQSRRVSVRAAMVALARGVDLRDGSGKPARWMPHSFMVEGGARVIASLLTDAAQHPADPIVRSVVVTVAPLYLLQAPGSGIGIGATPSVHVDAVAPTSLGGGSARLRLREPLAFVVQSDVVVTAVGFTLVSDC